MLLHIEYSRINFAQLFVNSSDVLLMNVVCSLSIQNVHQLQQQTIEVVKWYGSLISEFPLANNSVSLIMQSLAQQIYGSDDWLWSIGLCLILSAFQHGIPNVIIH